MNTVLVWILVTVSYSSSWIVSYSPPMADLESCQYLAANLPATSDPNNTYKARCVQVKVVK